MAKARHAPSCRKIEIPVARIIPDVTAFAALDSNLLPVTECNSKAVFYRDCTHLIPLLL